MNNNKYSYFILNIYLFIYLLNSYLKKLNHLFYICIIINHNCND